jgi:uncharacterized protein (DUF849 family)
MFSQSVFLQKLSSAIFRGNRTMDEKTLIINLAPTGMVPRKTDNPHLPITPEEIADDCARCEAAGASIFHLHARDDEGNPSWDRGRYRDIILAVRARCPDAIVCVSTSGRDFSEFEKRSAVLDLEGDAKPEMASLTLGSMNFPRQASVNPPSMIQALADRMQYHGIVPELEIFDFGMVDYANYLIEKKVLRAPFYFNLILGSLGTLRATPFNLISLVNQLPSGSVWAGAGIGKAQFKVNALSITMGGHVRVGLEDNLYLDEEKQNRATNVDLVKRQATLAAAAGRSVATPAEARRIIHLPDRR